MSRSTVLACRANRHKFTEARGFSVSPIEGGPELAHFFAPNVKKIFSLERPLLAPMPDFADPTLFLELFRPRLRPSLGRQVP